MNELILQGKLPKDERESFEQKQCSLFLAKNTDLSTKTTE